MKQTLRLGVLCALFIAALSGCRMGTAGVTPTPRPPVSPTMRSVTPTTRPTTPAPRVSSTPYPTRPPDLPQARVLTVIDGDTIEARISNQVITVRILGINTPEVDGPYRDAQCFGREASAFAKSLLSGATVYLERDRVQDDQDEYGRWLRYVWLADGRLFNLEAVEQGFALEYTYERDRPYTMAPLFRAAQRRAQEAQRGLWAPAACNGNIQQPPRTPAASPFPTSPPATPPVPVKSPTAPRPSSTPVQHLTPHPAAAWLAITGIRYAGDDEIVIVTNRGSQAQALAGWRLQSYGGSPCQLAPSQFFEFPSDVILSAGASVRIHSGPQAAAQPPSDLFWTLDRMWNNGGDRADLLDPAGALAVFLSYGDCP